VINYTFHVLKLLVLTRVASSL